MNARYVGRKQMFQRNIGEKSCATTVMSMWKDLIADADALVGEPTRYERQIKIFGAEGQKKLKKAKATIAGAGGLGSASATYLTVAGVGRIRVVDNDLVELSNLNRQIFEGQVTTIIPGKTACLRCLFPDTPQPETFPVIGATCGVIGCIQATEAVKYIVGVGELLTNRLLVWDGLYAKTEEFAIERNPKCEDCGDR
jgi:molybdopterin/thiamine biosynthesis adenylyltransferase